MKVIWNDVKRSSKPIALLIAVTGAVALAGCGGSNKEAEGPAEQTGEKVDNAAEDTKDKANEAAEDTKDKANDAADDVKDKTDDATH